MTSLFDPITVGAIDAPNRIMMAPFLANPDLPARLAKPVVLNTPNAKTFYTPGPAGYTDYPAFT